jgi:hypothetical protein
VIHVTLLLAVQEVREEAAVKETVDVPPAAAMFAETGFNEKLAESCIT